MVPVSPRRGELAQSLEKAQGELEVLKEQRTQQMQLTESIVRQRDMYRVLLAQATGVSFPQQGNPLPHGNTSSVVTCGPDVLSPLTWLTPPLLWCVQGRRPKRSL